jgi:hypothetical protein
MRARDAVSVTAALVILSLVALMLRGFPGTAAGLAAGIVLFGAALDLIYVLRRRGPRCLAHRRTLDWYVRAQLTAIAVAGLASPLWETPERR